LVTDGFAVVDLDLPGRHIHDQFALTAVIDFEAASVTPELAQLPSGASED
jgi:hypothetical protein